MDALERQLNRHSRSWQTFLGAPAITLALFLVIASTSIVVERPTRRTPPPIEFAYVPPPPAPVLRKQTPPLSPGLAESFKFDPTTLAPPPDIPLDLLDIRLAPDVDPGLAIALDMERTFEVQKPMDFTQQVVVFERNQVDEIPGWLYGPMPRLPSRLDRKDADALVLYIVSDKGRTENIYILDASDPGLMEPVKEAIADWRFRPARKAGKPVRVWVQHPVNFRPESKSPFSI
jgi:TonB family protein